MSRKRSEVQDALKSALASALASHRPYSERRRPTLKSEGALGGSPASVLILWGIDAQGDVSLLMTRRAENLETHKGQMAFPGGMRDAQDLDGIATALRETREEVGIPESQVEPVGVLPELWTVTGFLVTPVLGVLKEPIEQVPLIPNLEELDRVFWIPLSVLRREGVYRRESLEFGAVRYPVDVFLVDEYRIWGATGTLLKNLLDRLEGRLEGRLGA